MRAHFRPEHDVIIRQLFPTQGPPGVVAILPEFEEKQIVNRARSLRLKRTKYGPRPHITDIYPAEIDRLAYVRSWRL